MKCLSLGVREFKVKKELHNSTEHTRLGSFKSGFRTSRELLTDGFWPTLISAVSVNKLWPEPLKQRVPAAGR